MSPLRARRPPSAVTEALRDRLARRERVLGWAAYGADERSGHLVATDRALWEVPAGADPDPLPWDEVDRARWEDGRLLLQEAGVPGRGRLRRWEVPAPAALPEVIRDRVKASLVVDQWHRLAAGGGVRVLGRRSPADGELRWFLVFDRPADSADPAATAEARLRLREAREMVGA